MFKSRNEAIGLFLCWVGFGVPLGFWIKIPNNSFLQGWETDTECYQLWKERHLPKIIKDRKISNICGAG